MVQGIIRQDSLLKWFNASARHTSRVGTLNMRHKLNPLGRYYRHKYFCKHFFLPGPFTLPPLFFGERNFSRRDFSLLCTNPENTISFDTVETPYGLFIGERVGIPCEKSGVQIFIIFWGKPKRERK